MKDVNKTVNILLKFLNTIDKTTDNGIIMYRGDSYGFYDYKRSNKKMEN